MKRDASHLESQKDQASPEQGVEAAAGVTPASVEQLMAKCGGDPQKFGRALAKMMPAQREAMMLAAHELYGNSFVNLVYAAAYSDARVEDTSTDFSAVAEDDGVQQGFGGTKPLTPDQKAYADAMTAGEPGHAAIGAEEARKTAATSRPLTDQDRAEVVAAQKQLAGIKPKRIDDPNNPNLVQIEISFDGTGNNAHVDPWDTGPARLHTSFAGKGKIYTRGVATRGDTPNYLAEGATGVGIWNRVNETYDALVAMINQIKSGNEHAEVVLILSGFSRGSATARIFANALNARGVPVRDAHGNDVRDADGNVKKFDAPRIGVMLLFDTVYSYVGSYAGLNTPVPKNVENVLHLTASDEHRIMFPLRHAYDPKHRPENWHEIALPGAHSDVGGGYPNHYSDVAYNMAHDYMVRAGVQMKPNETAPVDLHDPSLRLHDSGGNVPGTNKHWARRHQY